MLFAAVILRKAILVSCDRDEAHAGKANYTYAVVLGVFKLQRRGR